MRGKGGRQTIRDLAAIAGVSISTASKALNDTGRMGEETRQRVKRVAREIGFRPNALAQGLLSKRSFTIGLLTNDTYGRFTLPVMAGVSEALVDRGVSVFLCAIEDDPALGQVHVDAMLDKQVDGIIATGKRVDRSLPIDLTDVPVPVVYAFTEGGPESVSFRSDDAHGATLAVEWLKTNGRQRIVHVTGPEDFFSVRERSGAFRATAGEGASVFFGEWSETWGRDAVERIWAAAGEKPDALFCGNDQIARGAVDALRERGIRVPEDVAIVGFDNWEIVAAQMRPPLTSVDMDLKELGRQAGLTILALAEGLTVEPGVRTLPCRLVVRQSCGAGGSGEAGSLGNDEQRR
ncbi:LacI family transcriptional regulator [Rhizobium sp. Leaf384]|uniref:LacI family DNA-binding transcriptional regulator n=1 Tax=unclassified Rhizobium TaxID=2613769 RepID=UPI0007160512|nr:MULTISPECIES: LacI family DNA-binding transcriptional regulator [unclassified Rhizobium]KQR72972.1 LacI family transcriptional regulator [Rhizobium sp. Leaf341]KQS75612.1 LacI family transcriptional regulator [Rhizobium sp. Leaf384]KQS75861.1 LacI family transcriptional regulator [Rhizobium sp. Leaf383]